MKLSDYTIGKFIKAVLAGQPGRGKTTAGLTFPTPMLIFDFDNKMNGPILWAKSHGIDISQIEVETPADWKYNWTIFSDRLDKFRRNPDKFKSFGSDSLTTIADFLLGITGEAKLAEGKAKKIGSIQVAGIDEYNAESSGIMDFLLFMKDVQANFWLTAHVLESKSPQIENPNKIIVSRTLLTGGKKVAAKIPAYFPENYALNVELPIQVGGPIKYVFYTQTNGEDYARTEFPIPARLDFTDRPFYTVLQEAIQATSRP